MLKLLGAFTLSFIIASPVWAAAQTITLQVPGMTCAACPITVKKSKKSLTRVDGVIEARVDYDQRAATVTFDDSKTNLRALTQATTDAGYPSRLGQ
jgi:mercuric ion binding protein